MSKLIFSGAAVVKQISLCFASKIHWYSCHDTFFCFLPKLCYRLALKSRKTQWYAAQNTFGSITIYISLLLCINVHLAVMASCLEGKKSVLGVVEHFSCGVEHFISLLKRLELWMFSIAQEEGPMLCFLYCYFQKVKCCRKSRQTKKWINSKYI